MIAALYVRKSTDQAGVADDQKSVARQIEHARTYAINKGWTVADGHVYVDDGISGAEFANRPGFLRLMNALKPRAPFQVLVMSEESRLGRETIETAYALKQLVTAGVRVFFYLEDRERTLESPTDKIMLSLTAFADELEREKARQRTYDAMQRKARAGHVTGGRCFGYDNVEVRDEAGRRVRVDRRIHKAQAAVVVEIFERCARGEGHITIAKALNAAGLPAPRAQQGRPCGWSPSTVREILHRPLYAGQIVWDKTRKRNSWGQARRSAKPADAWIRVDAPKLRVVPKSLWEAAQARIEDARQTYVRGTGGQLWGRPSEGVESKYLLTGLLKCAACGGSVFVRSRSHGQRRAFFYGCTSYHLRGRSVCGNNIEVPMASTNRLVLDALAGDILRPEHLERVIRGVVAALRPSAEDREAQRVALRAERGRLDQDLERLTAAITAGGPLDSIVGALKARESRREAVKRELASLGAEEINEGDVREIEVEARTRLTEWRELLQVDVVGKTRQMVKKLLAEPLQARPFEDRGTRGWELTGRGSYGKLLSGLLSVTSTVASPMPASWNQIVSWLRQIDALRAA